MPPTTATWTGDAPFIVSRPGVVRDTVYRHPEEEKPRNVKRTITVHFCVGCLASNGVTHQMDGDEELAAHMKTHEGHEPVNAAFAAPGTQVPLKDPNEGMAKPAKFVDEAETPPAPAAASPPVPKK